MSDKLQLVVGLDKLKFIGHTDLTRRTGLVQTTQIRVSFQAANRCYFVCFVWWDSSYAS